MTEIDPQQLVSIGEVAEITGLSQNSVRVYIARGTLPAPLVELSSGPIWLRAEIEHWNEFDRRRRPRGGGA